MILDILNNMAILAAISIVACEYLSNLTKVSGFGAQLQSWIVAIVIAFVANAIGFGFGSVNLFTDLLNGLFVGLIANGIFNVPFTQTVLGWIKARYIPVE